MITTLEELKATTPVEICKAISSVLDVLCTTCNGEGKVKPEGSNAAHICSMCNGYGGPSFLANNIILESLIGNLNAVSYYSALVHITGEELDKMLRATALQKAQAWFLSYKFDPRRCKRDNWTNDELRKIISGMKLIEIKPPAPQLMDDYNSAIDDILVRLDDFITPSTMSGAMAYFPEDKEIKHIGPILPA